VRHTCAVIVCFEAMLNPRPSPRANPRRHRTDDVLIYERAIGVEPDVQARSRFVASRCARHLCNRHQGEPGKTSIPERATEALDHAADSESHPPESNRRPTDYE
jgi:hypothetical protein